MMLLKIHESDKNCFLTKIRHYVHSDDDHINDAPNDRDKKSFSNLDPASAFLLTVLNSGSLIVAFLPRPHISIWKPRYFPLPFISFSSQLISHFFFLFSIKPEPSHWQNHRLDNQWSSPAGTSNTPCNKVVLNCSTKMICISSRGDVLVVKTSEKYMTKLKGAGQSPDLSIIATSHVWGQCW